MAIASLPEGMDPDEFLIAHGADGFNQVIAGATDVLTHKWKLLVRQFSSSPNDLTGQQRAVQHYLELLANARGAGPIDPIRWGSVLTRVSRLTEIPVDELNRQFRNTRPRRVQAPPPSAFSAEDGGDEPTFPSPDAAPNGPLTNGGKPPLAAREMAERHILGLLLVEPHRWNKLQVNLRVDDFVSSRHMRI